MSRKIRHSEMEFGSDSFLDIVANIVGILIILIVVAGVRVSQTPVLTSIAEEPSIVEPVTNEPEPKPITPNAPLPAPIVVTEPPPELVRQADRLGREIAALESKIQSTATTLKKWEARHSTLQTELKKSSKSLIDTKQQAIANKRQLSALRERLEKSKTEQRDLNVQLVEEIRTKPPATKLEHKLTPLSQIVQGNEIHFRISENRISHVPLNDLLSRLRSQVERQKNWLLKFNRHEGTVGPFDGYTMTYVVVRQQLSILDELRSGRSTMRIGVSEWKIEPEQDLQAETKEQALKAGSQFYRILLTAEPNTTLTFWVYPDSFKLFRQLQSFARNEGFTVAARPLPFGVPISGSPNGSRSAGQ